MKKLGKYLALVLAAGMLLGTAGCGDSTGSADGPSAGSDAQSSAAGTDAGADAGASSAAEPAADGEKVMVWNNGAEPSTIDPGYNGGSDAAGILCNMYEGLLKEKDNKMIGAAAESYDVSEDSLTYTFHMRDAKWSDGKPVRAQDFEFAWNRVKDEAFAAPYAWIFDAACIESYSAVDDKTFEVKLTSPAPFFLSLLDNSAFMPLREDVVEATDSAWATDPAKTVTNGAFTLEKYTTGDRIVLRKNPEYWDKDNVHIDRIDVLMIIDTATALTGYESGQIDVLREVPAAEIPRLLNEDPNFTTFPANGAYYYCFNVNKAPFDDIRVRQALTYAIDRTAIVNDVAKGGQEPAHSMVPSVIFDNDGNQFNQKSGDYGIPADLSKLEEAKQLLADAGYPDGAGFPSFEILYDTSDIHKTIAETIQQMWKQNLGIDCTLTNMESKVFHETRVAHNFDVCRGGWNGDYNDPLTYLDMFIPGTIYNYAGWNSEEYNTLVDTGKKSVGKDRFDNFYAADKLLMESFSYLPIYYNTQPAMVNNDKVTGWFMNSKNNYDFTNADLVQG